MKIYPRISIITPSYNDANFIETTILSLINQGYPNLEYIIIDGGSTDGTVEIIKKYENSIHYWETGKDKGMYYAIQKGFQRSTGNIMGWINSDDMHHTRSLFNIAQIFNDHKHIKWLQGLPNSIDDKGSIIYASPVFEVDKLFFYQKKHELTYKYIQQESTFWHIDLWKKAGSYISTEYKYAGDFELWMRFFQYEKLYNIHALLGSFRISDTGQASVINYKDYVKETYSILERYPLSKNELNQLKYRKFCEKLNYYFNKIHNKFRTIFNLSHSSVINNSLFYRPKSQKFE